MIKTTSRMLTPSARATHSVNSEESAPTAVSTNVLTAIQMLAANQATIVQQMAAFSLSASRPAHQTAAPAVHVLYVPQQGTTMQVPPVPAIHVPLIQPYLQGGGYQGGYAQGRNNRYSGYGGHSAGCRRGGRVAAVAPDTTPPVEMGPWCRTRAAARVFHKLGVCRQPNASIPPIPT
jgi:hypothetical protein